jgi:hypothetical protein
MPSHPISSTPHEKIQRI